MLVSIKQQPKNGRWILEGVAEALKENIEFEYYEITKSREMINILQQLPGEMQLALDFMFEEPSPIHLVNDGIDIP